MDWVDKPQNYKDLYGILQLLRFSHLNNFQLKTLKLGWVAFHSVTFQLKCLDFQSNQYKKLVPVLSRFCNGLYAHGTQPCQSPLCYTFLLVVAPVNCTCQLVTSKKNQLFYSRKNKFPQNTENHH